MATKLPKLKGLGGVREISRRIRGSDVIYDNRDALASELINLATANVSDIMEWDAAGNTKVKASKDISETAIGAIKKIRVTPDGCLELEMIDRVKVLQLLAKSAGILDREVNSDRPSVVEIQMVGPGEEKK